MKKISLENSNGILTRQVDVDDATSHLTVYDNTDAAIIDIEAHSSRHADGGEDPLPDASISTSMLQDGAVTNTKIADATIESTKLAAKTKLRYTAITSGITIGTAGNPVTILSLNIDTAYSTLFPLTITATPNGLGTSETATFNVKVTFDTGDSLVIASKTSTTLTNITLADFNFANVPNNSKIVTISLEAESSATTTTATAIGSISALEFYI